MKIIPLASPAFSTTVSLPLFGNRVPAGFPSPAQDYIEDWLDLNSHLVRHPNATFFVRASGHSMRAAGIQDQALLVVDRSLQPRDGDVVIASVDGELTCKQLDSKGRRLRAAEPGHADIVVGEGSDCRILGVVTHAVNRLCSRS